MKLSKFCNKISLILQALWCAVLYFLIEALCRHSVVEAWDYMTGKPLVFAYNTMFIFTTMLIVYLFHRRCFWRVVVSVFWLFLGIVNCILLMNRVTPFTADSLRVEADTAYILAEIRKEDTSGKMVTTRTILNLNSSEDEETQYLETWYPLDNGLISKKDVEIEY